MTSESRGYILWITGYAGAGKSTIARQVLELLKPHHANLILLDGDEFRAVFSKELGHSPEDRLTNAWRIARCAKFLSDQGLHVIVPTVSMYHDVRSWLRSQVPLYREIYLRASMETLLARDKKGLYSGALAGTVENVAGVNLKVDEPTDPDLVLENNGAGVEIADLAAQIATLVK